MILLRSLGRMAVDVLLLVARSGRLWVIIPVVGLALLAIVVGVAYTTVPTAVYVIF